MVQSNVPPSSPVGDPIKKPANADRVTTDEISGLARIR
jgi:hypothetical protein